MSISRVSFLIYVLLLFCLKVWGQEPNPHIFTHYKIADGLASNIVYNVIQDNSGFIWLSTINGLQRFDGNKFVTFKSDITQPYSLPTDEVTQAYKDRNGNLWVLTNDNKVGIFNTSTFRYNEVPVQAWSKGNTYVQKTFLETLDGRLLLYMNYQGNVFEYSPTAHAFTPSTYIRVPDNWTINLILQDRRTQKFIITTDSGFVVFNPKSKNISYHDHNTENEPLINYSIAQRFIHYAFLSSDGRLFYEQWPKGVSHPTIHVFDLKTAATQEYNFKKDYNLGYHLINAMLEKRNGKIWICGLPFLAEYTREPEAFQFIKKDYNKAKDLKFNQAYSMFEDRQQNLWISTDYGLYVFTPNDDFFQTYSIPKANRTLVEGRAQTALQLSNGEIWVGYRDLGLFRYDTGIKPLRIPASIERFQKMKSVWDIHQHSKTGAIWIALQGGQLIVYDTASKQSQLLTSPFFEYRAITQITEDKQGNLWFGTQAGNIVKWEYAPLIYDLKKSFSLIRKAGMINKLFADIKGYVWAAVSGGGLLKIDPVSNKVISQLSKNSSQAGANLWNNSPNDIIQYNDSLLLIASGALDLLNMNTHLVKHISTRDGLPSNTVTSMVKDATGVVWLGTLNGLCRMNLNALSFAVYDQNDGLPDDDFNVAGAFALNGNRLLFTSNENFIVFNPLHAIKTAAIDTASITGFKVSNVSLLIDSLQAFHHVSLSYDRNSVVFEFSALNYCRQNKLDYYYKLQGFDTAWIKSDGNHQAIYNFLPPRHYVFEVKTKNMDGRFSNAIAHLTIWIEPPFWRTWWFYTVVFLLAVLVLYWIDHERMRRLKTLHDVRTEIASHLHIDVSTTLNNINVLSQIAKLKADKDIVRSKELIDEISDKSYNMVVNMDEILWSIDPNNDTMQKTLQRIYEYAENLETKHDATIDIVVHEKVKDLSLDMKVRHDFFVVCKDTLQSLVQYSKSKTLLVDIDFIRSRILLKILSHEPESINYRLNMMELKEKIAKQAAALHAHLSWESDKKQTSIILAIPVR